VRPLGGIQLEGSRRKAREVGRLEIQARRGSPAPVGPRLGVSSAHPASESGGEGVLEVSGQGAAGAEEAAVGSEGFFRILAEQSPNMIFINKMGRVVYANRACRETMGFTREEFYSPEFSFLDLVAPESKSVVMASFSKHVDGLEIPPYEYSLVTKDGRRIEAIITTKLIEYGGDRAILGIVTDITARKRAEEELKRSERMLTIVNQIAETFLTSHDEETFGEVLDIVLEVMESKHGVFGYIDERGSLVCPSLTKDLRSQCQMPGKDIRFPRESWGGIWGRALKEGRSLYSNEPSHLLEGHIPIERALDVPIKHHGRVIGNILVGDKETDYDEADRELLEAIVIQIGPALASRLERSRQERIRRRMEERLRRSNELNETIMNSLPGVFYLFDSDGRVLRWNENLERITGYTSEEIVRMDALDLIPAEQRDMFRERMMEVIAKGQSWAEAALLSKDGTVTPHFFTGRRITLDQRQCVAGVGIDISEQKETRDRLHQSEKRFAQAFHAAPIGISINRLGDGVFLDANETFLDLLEYHRGEVVQNPDFDITELFAPEDRNKFLDALAETGFSLRDFEAKIHTKPGDVRDVLISIEPIQLEGRTCLLAMTKDITKQKKAQRELIQSEKLAGIGTLASGIAHEINNPLTGVMGFAEAILHESDPERMREYATRILDSAERAENVVKWLSSYSRKGVDSDVTDVDLAEVIRHALLSLKLTGMSADVAVRMDVGDIPRIRGNGTELEQVFVNILNNSVDAMPDGGEVRLTASAHSGMVEVRVSDTGEGIPKRHLGQVFDPFFTTKEVGKGTGLGLYVTSMIVVKHHGTIDLESAEGEGTTVTLRFPAAADGSDPARSGEGSAAADA
jgi:PAS domain S-box-containing protein